MKSQHCGIMGDMKAKYLIGIDEAGRGPLAGPVAVGLVKVAQDFDWAMIPGVNDSKKLSEKKREEIFNSAKELAKQGFLEYSVKFVSAQSIDSKGIVSAIRRAIAAGIVELELNPEECFIKLDGSLKAPAEFNQETIIKGDSSEKVIGLASIMAKVIRDHYMLELDTEFPSYGFARHKGYGTKNHREAIKKYGFSVAHRQSFCGNIEVVKD
ncbi:ribonuclease HII [Candidatus Nomurabacteria bacterium]|nr:ribonuclease HII [Candidatus Kaiserbacteria bacterium]MCB9814207.1 ribonuclease HII [Candidatus Nomurabacteria bacterium]